MLKANITLGGHRLDLSEKLVVNIIRRWELERINLFARNLIEISNHGELTFTLSYRGGDSSLMNAVFDKHKTNCNLISEIAKASHFLEERTDDELLMLMEKCSSTFGWKFVEELFKREKLLGWLLEQGSETDLRILAEHEYAPKVFLIQLAQHSNQSIALLAKYQLTQIEE